MDNREKANIFKMAALQMREAVGDHLKLLRIADEYDATAARLNGEEQTTSNVVGNVDDPTSVRPELKTPEGWEAGDQSSTGPGKPPLHVIQPDMRPGTPVPRPLGEKIGPDAEPSWDEAKKPFGRSMPTDDEAKKPVNEPKQLGSDAARTSKAPSQPPAKEKK